MLREKQIDAFLREVAQATTPPKTRQEVLESEAIEAAEKLHISLRYGLTAQNLQPYVEGKNIQRHHFKEVVTLLSRLDHLYGISREIDEELANKYAAWIQALLPSVFEVFDVHEVRLGKFGTVYNPTFDGQEIPRSEYVPLNISA